MTINFLGQGFEAESPNSAGNYLIRNFSSDRFNRFFGMSAFASVAGVRVLSEHILRAKASFESLSLIVGVDQEGTSREALNELLTLDIGTYVFYQKEPPIFHPKIYLFEGSNDRSLIVGSSNLTARGIFENVESSVLIEFNREDQAGNEFLTELKSYYSGLFNLNDPNLFRLTSDLISRFVNKGIVPTENARRAKHDKKANPRQNSAEQDDFVIPARSTSRIPRELRSRPRTDSVVVSVIEELELQNTEATQNGILVWQSGPLTERDLNIPTGSNTNNTGSMLFKKGLLEGIDQRHYFRDEVFSSLPWASDPESQYPHLERATAFFRVIVMGIDHGVFSMSLTHNTKTDTKTYEQKNSMTSISWGSVKGLIAKEELIGKSASLFKIASSTNEFTLVIEALAS